jgi:hypothetical protein
MLGEGIDRHLRPRWLQPLATFVFLEPSHWIMQTRQFTNLKRRVARDSAGVDGATVTAFAGTGNAN